MIHRSLGLSADARVLINKARIECQSHRLTVEDSVSIEYITRYIAGVQQVTWRSFTAFSALIHPRLQEPGCSTVLTIFFNYPCHLPLQKYTQSGGVRPFGISTLIMGFDSDKVPKLYQTDPSGVYSAWKANSIGRSSKTVREFLEKNYKEDMDKAESIKLAIRSLLEACILHLPCALYE